MECIKGFCSLVTWFGKSLLVVILLQLGSPDASAIEVQHKSHVVELFTSQGCSSCPPADALLKTFGREKKILALAWHVDYWDYLGWKDVFGSSEFSARQWKYARSLKEKQVYTPQAVINGHEHINGSSKNGIRAMLNEDSALLKPMNLTTENERLILNFNQKAKARLVLTAVWFDNSAETRIKRGENSGRTIVYSNIVKAMKTIATGHSGFNNLEISLGELEGKGQNCALLIQEIDEGGNPARIVSAAVVLEL